MSTWSWQVENRTRFGWSRLVDKLSQEKAAEAAATWAAQNPLWKIRIHDTSTGEVIHTERNAA